MMYLPSHIAIPQNSARVIRRCGNAVEQRKELNDINSRQLLEFSDIGYVKLCDNPEERDFAYFNFAELQLQELYDTEDERGVPVQQFSEVYAQRYTSSLKQMYREINKKVSDEELEDMVKDKTSVIFDNVTEMAKMIDTDGDGYISCSELAAFEKEMDEFDGKGDGIIVNGAPDVWFESKMSRSIFDTQKSV